MVVVEIVAAIVTIVAELISLGHDLNAIRKIQKKEKKPRRAHTETRVLNSTRDNNPIRRNAPYNRSRAEELFSQNGQNSQYYPASLRYDSDSSHTEPPQ